jgi:hypothetical protein
VLGYEVWIFHSESGTRVIAEDEHDCDVGDVDKMDEMLEAIQAEVSEDPPIAEVEAFFKLRKSCFKNTQKWPFLPSSLGWWPLSPSISSPTIATTIS